MTTRIDAHHHLWDLERREQTWMTDAMASIRRNFDVDELAGEAMASGVDATVVVQTVEDATETEELLLVTEDAPLIAGVVGYVDIAAADVGDQLDRLLAHRAGRWLVAIRTLVQYEPDPEWLVRRQVIAGLRAIARRGLAFDLLIRHDQFNAAVRAVTIVDDGRFVLDHLAKPDIGARHWEPWASAVSDLAQRENVAAKASGLVTEASWTAWSPDDLRPYVDHALVHFTPDRLMFGSDWPVCTLAASYSRVVDAVDDIIGDLSADEQAAIWGATARSVYRLEVPCDRIDR